MTRPAPKPDAAAQVGAPPRFLAGLTHGRNGKPREADDYCGVLLSFLAGGQVRTGMCNSCTRGPLADGGYGVTDLLMTIWTMDEHDMPVCEMFRITPADLVNHALAGSTAKRAA